MNWLKQLFSRRRQYDELSQSIREHLNEKIADLMDRGMTREQAERTAHREFGNVTRIEERSREVWQSPKIESIWSDAAFAIRQLWKTPGFTATAFATLSLSLAAALCIFSFVDSAFFEPLPYTEPSQLVQVFESIRQAHRMSFSHDNYLDVRRLNRVFASMAAYDVRTNFVLQQPSGAQRVTAISVTGGFFRTLGIAPARGRDFGVSASTETATTAPAEVMLSDAAWRKRYAGRADILGSTVDLNGQPYIIIGILPRSFIFAPSGNAEFWTTLHAYSDDSCESQRGCHVFGVIARLKGGVSLKQATDDVRSIAARLKEQYPGADRDEDATLLPLNQVILGDVGPILLTLLFGSGLLLLIAYSNVTGLLLVRSERRRQEFAIRGALGAVRTRLVQQLFIEGFVLLTLSVAAGGALAVLMKRLLVSLLPDELLNSMPYLRSPLFNWHLLMCMIALLVIASVLFSIIPALRIPLGELRTSLSDGGRSAAGTSWKNLGSRLVVLELALAMVLLSGAGLLAKSFYRLLHVDIGFTPSHLALIEVEAPEKQFAKGSEQITLQQNILRLMSSVPGVMAVGTANGLPVGWISTTSINFAGEVNLSAGHEVGERQVSVGYFSALQARLLSGRYFTTSDNDSSPNVVIVNETLARELFPSGNALGKQIFPGGQPQSAMQIVGIVGDIKEGALDEKNVPFIYRPFQQVPSRSYGIVVRTAQDPASILSTLGPALHSIEPNIALSTPDTMTQTIDHSPAAYLHRAATSLVGGFAILSLLLGVIGLYGVIAYSVAQRTRELGVRMALGAQRGTVYGLIFKEAGWLTACGIMGGLFGSVAVGIWMRSLLFQVRFWDTAVLSSVAALLAISALLASYVPARRAASIDPIQALRAE